MGGLLILASLLSATLLLANPRQSVRLDRDLRDADLRRDRLHRRLLSNCARGKGQGLSGPQKLVWQFACAFIASSCCLCVLRFDTHLTVPFFKNVHPELARDGFTCRSRCS